MGSEHPVLFMGDTKGVVVNGKYKFEMIGGEIVMDEKQITQETLQDVQSKVIELMSATLELNKQLHAMANIELYKKRIKELESQIAEFEIRRSNNWFELSIAETDLIDDLRDDLHFEQYKNRCLQMEIDKLKRESQPERKYVEQIDW